MINNPILSIIIPTYNVEKYIIATLHSIEVQTFKDFEVIIVDDDSSDNTYAICRTFMETHSSLRIECYQVPHGGVSKARNFGIGKSTGKYIHFMDSDDELEPDMYEMFYKLSLQHDYDIIVGAVNVIKPTEQSLMTIGTDINIINKAKIVHWLREITVADKDWMLNVVWNKWFKRSIIKENNLLYKNICPGEDYEFVMQYLAFCESGYICSKPIYNYFQRGTSSLLNRKYSHESQIERRTTNWNTTQNTLASIGVFNPSFLLAEGYSLYSSIYCDMRSGENIASKLEDYYQLKQYQCVSLYFKTRKGISNRIVGMVMASKITLLICALFKLKFMLEKFLKDD